MKLISRITIAKPLIWVSALAINLLLAGSAFATSCTATIGLSSSSIIPCSPITYTATPAGTGGITTCKWYRNNYQVSGNTLTFTDSTPRFNDSVWVVMVTRPCTTQVTVTSNKIYARGVNLNVPAISVTVNSLALGTGTNPVFVASTTDAGYRPTYAWYLNTNLIVGPVNSVMSYGGALGNGDQIYATVTKTSCGAALSATSNTLTMTKPGSGANQIVAYKLPNQIGVSVIDTLSATVICTLPAGNTKIMQPMRCLVSTNASYGPSIYGLQNFTTPVNYAVRAQNGSTKAWTVVVVDSCTPFVSIRPDHNTPCSTITFTAFASNAGTSPSFQWFMNNIPSGTNSPIFIDSTPNFNDSVWVVMTSTPCAGVRYNTSNVNVIDGSGSGGFSSVSITANSNNLDSNANPIFTATSVNAGTGPIYTWYLNGVQVGDIHNLLLSYGGALGNDDKIWASVTTVQCGGSTVINSDTIIMHKSGSNAKNITFFSIPTQIGNAMIDTTAATVTATVAYGSRTSMHPDRIYISNYASYGPSLIVNRDFSGPVTYTVVAQNGSSKVWTVTLRDPSGFKTSPDATSIIEDAPAAISDMFNAYPIPARVFINLDITESSDATTVTILDLEGRTMYAGQIAPNATSHQISIADFANGIYLLNVSNGEKNATKRIAIAH